MDSSDPMLRMLRRTVVGFAVGGAFVAFGVFLLSVAALGDAEGGGGADTGTGVLTPVLGWAALAAGPAVGLRIGGLAWERALWSAPVLPLLVLLLDLLG